MALAASTVFEIQTGGSSANGGGFDVGSTNFATDLAATVATSSAPVVTSASYTFLARDVGALLYVKSGTNWIPGFYPIASVSAGAATLTASIGGAELYGGAALLNTVTGCATTASPTAGTWGVDYSRSTSAAIAYTDLVIDGTTNTKFTSAANPVGKNLVGNLINVTGGTGFTVQRVQVVSTATTTATCDKSLGTLSSTGGTGNLGGCLDSHVTLAAVMLVGSGKAYMKTGTYTSSALVTFGTAGVSPSGSVPYTRLIGYASTRGDITTTSSNQASRPNLMTTTLNAAVLAFTGSGWLVENLIVGPSGVATCGTGIALNGIFSGILNCKVSSSTNRGIILGGSASMILACEITACNTDAALLLNSNGSVAAYNDIHDNTCSLAAIYLASSEGSVYSNLLTNNASGPGINFSGRSSVCSNTIYASGGSGILINAISGQTVVRGNLLVGNGGYGLAGPSGAPAMFLWDGNAYYLNTSGTRNNLNDTTVNPVHGVAPYLAGFDVILTADPFVAKASNDYRLNTTAGGGAACRGHGVPTSWPGNSLTTSAPDMGAVQHVDAGGASGIIPVSFDGGF